MNYEYYKHYDTIYRIERTSSGNDKMEWYYNGSNRGWKKAVEWYYDGSKEANYGWKEAIISSITIIENINTKKITKDELFMEML